eukprot:TRINITY_DN14062_c0_g1_i1.p1 TRINITY_DN14062_c0_g1~~TRINITY_DN14062_c0_g1_i1.p1  ORF type:complete len:740 (+),score=114.67 TRINITY_DN14062_c0_g1_i1:86-2305(+)
MMRRLFWHMFGTPQVHFHFHQHKRPRSRVAPVAGGSAGVSCGTATPARAGSSGGTAGASPRPLPAVNAQLGEPSVNTDCHNQGWYNVGWFEAFNSMLSGTIPLPVLEAQRREAERREAERLEAERLEAERLEALKRSSDADAAADEQVQEDRVEQPHAEPLLAYPVTRLRVGEHFAWLPSELGCLEGHFSIIEGALPEGVDLDSDSGRISGCAAVAGSQHVTVRRGTASAEVHFEVSKVSRTITTFAGNGTNATKPDSGELSLPRSVAANDHFLFVVSGDRIVRIPRVGGQPVVIAGGGDSEEDDIPAAQSKLPDLRSIALGPRDILYLRTATKIRRMSIASGSRISPVTHDLPGLQGIAVADKELFVPFERKVYRVDLCDVATVTVVAGGGGQDFTEEHDCKATAVDIGEVRDVCVSGGGLFIIGGSRVWRVDLATDTITVAAGGGTRQVQCQTHAKRAKLDDPRGLTAGGDGKIYFTDKHRVYMLSGNALTVISGGRAEGFWGDNGPADEAHLNLPMAVSASGSDLYVADSNNHRIRRIEIPSQPPASSPQAQRWEPRRGSEAGWVSSKLQLSREGATVRLRFANPPDGAHLALSFLSDEFQTGRKLLLRAVRHHGNGHTAEGDAQLVDNEESAGSTAPQSFYFRYDNILEADLESRVDDETDGVTYTLTNFTLNGKPILPDDELSRTAGRDTPMHLCLSCHSSEDAAGNGNVGFIAAPLLIEGDPLPPAPKPGSPP